MDGSVTIKEGLALHWVWMLSSSIRDDFCAYRATVTMVQK